METEEAGGDSEPSVEEVSEEDFPPTQVDNSSEEDIPPTLVDSSSDGSAAAPPKPHPVKRVEKEK